MLDEIPSLCPTCGERTTSVIFAREGRVYQRPGCARHSDLEALIFSDSALFEKLERWNELVFGKSPADAEGYKDSSRNSPSLGVIDITNRCNYHCPLCFAEASREDSHYYLPLETIRGMLGSLLGRSPVPCRHIQFSGGEPTLHPEFPQILRLAREMGFTHIQIATNGSRFVNPDFTRRCEDMGLQTLYLQFDGMSDEVYGKLRGQPLLDKKIAIVRNITSTNMRLVLVPTVVAGVNVDQLRPIFEFAVEHSKHITGISIQPAASIGRVQVNGNGSRPQPFNLGDLAMEFSRQTGLTRSPEDWFPLNAIAIITRGLARLRGEALPDPACDAHCSLGTYFHIDANNKPVCITRFFDLGGFLQEMAGIGPRPKGLLGRRISQLAQLGSLSGYFDRENAPDGMSFLRLLRGLEGWEDKSVGRGPQWFRKGFNGMFVAGMHFMDGRNYNFRRLGRCIIQYVTLDGQVVPFCSYNAGVRRRSAEEVARKTALLPVIAAEGAADAEAHVLGSR